MSPATFDHPAGYEEIGIQEKKDISLQK